MSSHFIDSLEPRRLLSAGALDNTFGEGSGIVTTELPGGLATMHDLAVLPDGRILIAGAFTPHGATRADAVALVARYNADGSLDTTFSAARGDDTPGWQALESLPLGFSRAKLELYPGGRFLIASGNTLARFLPGGAPDPRFGPDGSGIVIATQLIVRDIALQPDGMLVLAGHKGVTTLKRLRFNGSTDVTFGDHGVAKNSAMPARAVDRVEVVDHGRILIAGSNTEMTGGDNSEYNTLWLRAAAFNSDGSIDTGYATNGVVTESHGIFGGTSAITHAAHDGTVVFVFDDSETFRIIRLTPTGQRDVGFAGSGLARFHFGGTSWPEQVIQQSDRGMLIAGYTYTGVDRPDGGISVIRITPQGELDTTFGTEGRTTTPLISETRVNAAALGTDGSLIVGGTTAATDLGFELGGQLALARYWRDEAPAGQLIADDVIAPYTGSYRFKVIWRDDVAVNVSTLDSGDLYAVLPDGSTRNLRLMRINKDWNGAIRHAYYRLTSPDGQWDASDNGLYTIRLRSNRIADTAGHFAAARTLGTFRVDVA